MNESNRMYSDVGINGQPDSECEVFHAVPQPETKVEQATGLRGWVGQLAQFGAVGVVCVLLYMHQRENAEQSRDERAMFREELKETRIDHKAATNQLATGLENVRQAVEVNTNEVKRVAEAVKAKK